MTTNHDRRLRALTQHYGPPLGSDSATLRRECDRLAAEVGVSPAELWAEAEHIAALEAQAATPDAFAAAMIAEYGLDPSEVRL